MSVTAEHIGWFFHHAASVDFPPNCPVSTSGTQMCGGVLTDVW
jgi:hypothetical protein